MWEGATDLDLKFCEQNELPQSEKWGCRKREIRTWKNLGILTPFSLIYVVPS